MYLKIESALSMCAKLALAKRKARTGPVELFGRLILANPPRGSDSVVAPARVARVEAVRGVVVAVAVDGRALAARPRQDVVDVREVVLGRVLRRPRLTGGWRAGGRRRRGGSAGVPARRRDSRLITTTAMTAVMTAAGNTQDQTMAAPVATGMSAITATNLVVDWPMFFVAIMRARPSPTSTWSCSA